MELTIKLSQEQVQRALNVLGQAPYIEIADVIDSIKNQANEQMQELNNGGSKNEM